MPGSNNHLRPASHIQTRSPEWRFAASQPRRAATNPFRILDGVNDINRQLPQINMPKITRVNKLPDPSSGKAAFSCTSFEPGTSSGPLTHHLSFDAFRSPIPGRPWWRSPQPAAWPGHDRCGCTRARDHLLVTGVEPVSEFLDDMTDEVRTTSWVQPTAALDDLF